MNIAYKLLFVGLASCGLLPASLSRHGFPVLHHHVAEKELVRLLLDPDFDISFLKGRHEFDDQQSFFLASDIDEYWEDHWCQALQGSGIDSWSLARSVATLWLAPLSQDCADRVVLNPKFRAKFFNNVNVADICRSVPFEKKYLLPILEKTPVVSFLKDRVVQQADQFVRTVVASLYIELQQKHRAQLHAPKDSIEQLMHSVHCEQLQKREKTKVLWEERARHQYAEKSRQKDRRRSL